MELVISQTTAGFVNNDILESTSLFMIHYIKVMDAQRNSDDN